MTPNFRTRPLSGEIDRLQRTERRAYVQGGLSRRERLRSLALRLRARGGRRLFVDVILAGGGIFILYALFLWLTLPDISDPRSLIASQSSVIVDRSGTELYRLYREEDRTFIPGDQIPSALKDAIVAIEDERFYDRGCLDMRAIARAVFRFGSSGGASTLTRQLARNALDLKREYILNRKLKELILGCQLESQYGKEELLNLYLNWIPFGQNAYGVELASRTYFNIPAKDLSLAQSAVLAALPQRPTYFSPYGKHVRTTVTERALGKILDGTYTAASQIPDEDIRIGLLGSRLGTGATTVAIGGRTDQVLKNMENLGSITETQRLQALKELETLSFKPSRENIRAPHFVLWVKSQVDELVAGGAEEGILNQGGLTIETTLDWEMQQVAESLMERKRADIAKVYEAHNIALVSVATGTNEILAYVGNADYDDEAFDGKVDMARAPRQPGSSFKPIVYAAAFEKGAEPGTVLYDVPTKVGDETPQNFDGSFWGLASIRRALAGSRNIPAIKAYFYAGEDDAVLDMAERLGAPSPAEQKRTQKEENRAFEYGWPLALGAGETPLLEMVQAYATFAANGVMKPLTGIKRIKDRRGNILYEADPDDTGTEAIDPRIAYQITSVLSDTAARPNEYWQSVLSVPGFAAAAKTGTSNKCLKRDEKNNCTERKPSDLWTMGYTPNIVTGVWVGNADASPLAAKAESLSVAAPLWKEYMVGAHKLLKHPAASFPMPSGLVQLQISTLSGELPTECTPVRARASDIFLEERAPAKADPACVRLAVDRVTGLLASSECPAEAAEERSFLAPLDILPDRFPHWQSAVLSWAKDAMKAYDPMTGAFSGSALPLPIAPTEQCSLARTPGRAERPRLTIEYPEDGGGAPYPSFQPRLQTYVGSKIRELRATVDGKPAGSATEEPFDLTLRIPRSIKEGGLHTLTVTLVDEYFNTASDTVEFRFEEDSTGPEVRFVSPQGSLTVKPGEEITLEATAEDREGGIKYVEFFLDARLLSSKPKDPYRLTWPQDLTPGVYSLRAVATDMAGNTGEDAVELTVRE